MIDQEDRRKDDIAEGMSIYEDGGMPTNEIGTWSRAGIAQGWARGLERDTNQIVHAVWMEVQAGRFDPDPETLTALNRVAFHRRWPGAMHPKDLKRVIEGPE